MTIDEAALKITALEQSVEGLQATVEAQQVTLETQHDQIKMLKAHLFGVAFAVAQKGLLEPADLEGGTSAFTAHSMARAVGCHDPRPKFFESLLPPTKSAA